MILILLLFVLLLHAESLAVPGQVDDERVRPEGDPGHGVAEDVHHHYCSLKLKLRFELIIFQPGRFRVIVTEIGSGKRVGF